MNGTALAKRTAFDAIDGLTHHVEQATLDALAGRHRDACAVAWTAMPRLKPSVASIEMARTVSSPMCFWVSRIKLPSARSTTRASRIWEELPLEGSGCQRPGR